MTVPTNPDGTPNLGIITTTGNSATTAGSSTSGQLNIWDIPSDIAGQTIWYDTGHRQKTTISAAPGSSRLTPDFGVDSTGAQTTTTEKHRVAYQVNSTPDQIMAQMAAMSYNDPAKYLAIQTMLAQGTWGTVHVNGSFDVDTEKALAGAMSQYLKLTHGAGVGISFTDYLARTSATNQALIGQTPAAPLAVTDPASIRSAAQTAAQQALGQGLSESQLSAFVAQFQSAQTSAETATSGTVSAPDLSAQAMQFAQGQEPGAYHAEQRQSYENALVNLFSGPGAALRPDMTPVASA